MTDPTEELECDLLQLELDALELRIRLLKLRERIRAVEVAKRQTIAPGAAGMLVVGHHDSGFYY